MDPPGSATAQRVQPYAATPRLQRALLLEQGGVLASASVAARAATAREEHRYGMSR